MNRMYIYALLTANLISSPVFSSDITDQLEISYQKQKTDSSSLQLLAVSNDGENKVILKQYSYIIDQCNKVEAYYNKEQNDLEQQQHWNNIVPLLLKIVNTPIPPEMFNPY